MKSAYDVSDYSHAFLRVEPGDIEEAQNPLLNLDKWAEGNFHLHVLSLLRNPRYFYWTAKQILGINLLPEQVVILQELWDKSFPMYLASRGFGKAQPTLNSTVLTKSGWKKMGEIKVGDQVYGRNGKLSNVLAIHPQGQQQVYRIKLADGRTVECCGDHLWTVLDTANKRKEKTLSTKDMFKNKISYQGKTGGPSYRYRIPQCEPIQYSKKDLPIDPYILGCLLGDGSMAGSTPRISSDDDFIIQEFRDRLDGFELVRDWTNNNYAISDREKEKGGVVHGGTGTTYLCKTRNRLTTKIRNLNLNVRTKGKFIPQEYKLGSIEQRMEIIRGLLDTDGSINASGAIEFTNTCEQLVDDLIDICRSLGIRCQKAIDDRSGQFQEMPQGTIRERTPYFRVYINTSAPVFKLPRKLNRIKEQSTIQENYVSIVDIEKLEEFTEMQCISVDAADHTYITDDYVVTHNSFLMAVYATLRCLLIPETKIVIVGAAFRQSKVIFEYMDTIWRNAPILRSLCTDSSGPRRDIDRCTMKINNSWAIAVPLGDGEKIRGLRAHTILADEFNSIPIEIYEKVVAGFTAVSKDPFNNVVEAFKRKGMMEDGVWEESHEEVFQSRHKNQSIISGTAGYDFEPYADYWKKYCATIKNKGNMSKILGLDEDIGEMPEYMANINPNEFCVIRIPYELIPEGFMDAQQVSRARATMHSGIYGMEYGTIFAKDSTGFFKRTTIESCVANEKNISQDWWPTWCVSPFNVMTRGNKSKTYVFGIDPASEIDNFAVIVLEINDGHQRVVYSWTTNKKDYQARKKIGLTQVDDYYSFCVRKIRDLMQVFPCVRIGIDSQGGGYQIAEGLRDPDKMRPEMNEVPILPIIEDKEKDTDRLSGLHILEFVNFASAEWTSQANHGLKKDMEDRVLLFPQFDNLTLGLVSAEDKIRFEEIKKEVGDSNALKLYDTLEDLVMDVEELKTELSTIMVTRTASGRERFDTPEIKLGTGKKGRMRKDRYSALVIANMLARTLHRNIPPPTYNVIGRVASADSESKDANTPMYVGHDWAKNYTINSVGIVRRDNY